MYFSCICFYHLMCHMYKKNSNFFHCPAYGLFLSVVTDCDDCDLYSLNKLGQKKTNLT